MADDTQKTGTEGHRLLIVFFVFFTLGLFGAIFAYWASNLR